MVCVRDQNSAADVLMRAESIDGQGNDQSKSPATQILAVSESSTKQDRAGSESPVKQDQAESGSGWGGTWTPTDDFLTQKRKTCWKTEPQPKQAPPRVYLDNQTLIREVTDVTSLRHGDHCLTALNPCRIISPKLDYMISLLGNLELSYYFHHFIVCDDVHHMDEQGVPRTADGKIVQIVEYSNTPIEALVELKTLCSGNILRFPGALCRFLFNKASCHQAALADYGDTPHIYRIVEQTVSLEERGRIVKEAIDMTKVYQPYNLMLNNCEHAANTVHYGEVRSHNAESILWSIFRICLCCVGLIFLNAIAAACYNRFCMGYPIWALLAYHLFTSVPVGLQTTITYAKLYANVWRQYHGAVIDRDDCYHILAKEFGRVIVVGGLAIVTITLMPKMIQDTQLLALACALCFFAYLLSDLLYNVLAQAVMRLFLLPIFGRVWLIGNRSKTD